MKRITKITTLALLSVVGTVEVALLLGPGPWQLSGRLNLCAAAGQRSGTFYLTPKGTRVWRSPSGGWEVLTNFMTRDLTEIREFLRNKPPGAQVAEMYEVMATEPGVWMGFTIRFGRVQRVVFTKNTKIVLFDRDGTRHESETCLFSPDLMQTRVLDPRRTPVVVSRRSVWCHSRHGLPVMDVKFREGEFKPKDLVEFEVVGAVEDTLQQPAE